MVHVLHSVNKKARLEDRRWRVIVFQASLVAWPTIAASTLSTPFVDYAQCAAVLTPYDAVYVSRYRGLPLQGSRSMRLNDEGHVLLSHEVAHFGSRISEQTYLQADRNNLRVLEYHKVQSIFGIRREDHAEFDWVHRVIRTRGRRERSLPLDGTHLDPLSYQLALRCDMAQGKQAVRYQVVRAGRIKRYAFRRVGTEQLDTSLGRMHTIVIERVRDNDGRSTRIWLAPRLRYLLVQLKQQDNEDDLDVTLRLNAVEFHARSDPQS